MLCFAVESGTDDSQSGSSTASEVFVICLQDLGWEENAGDTRNIPAGPSSQDGKEPCPDRSLLPQHVACMRFLHLHANL